MTRQDANERIAQIVKGVEAQLAEAEALADLHNLTFTYGDRTYNGYDRSYENGRDWDDSGCSIDWDDSGC